MADEHPVPDMENLRKWVHQVNNHMGVILATAELLQLDQLPPTRRRTMPHDREQSDRGSRGASIDIRPLFGLRVRKTDCSSAALLRKLAKRWGERPAPIKGWLR
jgi:hypothetical protein